MPKSILRCSKPSLLLLLTLEMFGHNAIARDELALSSDAYVAAAPILKQYCTPCHNRDFAYSNIALDSESDVIRNSAVAFRALNSGLMPLGDPSFKNTEDGLRLLSYFQSLSPGL